jgi:hypothetical protein
MEWREVRISAGPKGAFHTVPVQPTCSLPEPQTAVRTVYISLLLSLFRVDIERYGTGQIALFYAALAVPYLGNAGWYGATRG